MIFFPSSNSELAPLPQHLTPLIDGPDAEHAKNHEPGQEADAAVDAHPLEHGTRDEDGGEGEEAAGQAVGGEDGGRVAGVDVGDVEQDGLEDEVDA